MGQSRHPARRLAFLCALLVAAPAGAAIIRVPADASTIQAGIDLAAPGDEVLVGPGVYTGAGNRNLDLHGKIIAVRGEAGAAATIIDCAQAGRGFMLIGLFGSEAVIEGFTIENGSSGAGVEGGGGIFIAGGAPTIRNCVLTHNTARGESYSGGGGGLVAYSASSLIVGCTFTENTVTGDVGALGGGLAAHTSALVIRDCLFERNTAAGPSSNGGGLGNSPFSLDRTPVAGAPRMTIEDSRFIANKALAFGGAVVPYTDVIRSEFRDNWAAHSGGGIGTISTVLTDCRITNNRAEVLGGGVNLVDALMSSCLIAGNTAPIGGGVWIGYGVEVPRLVDCVIAGNVATEGGGGAHCLEEGVFERCTFVGNTAPAGSAIQVQRNLPAETRVENSILALGLGGAAVACSGQHTVRITCSDVFGNAGGDWTGCIASQYGVNGNIALDPMFCDPAAGDWHLCAESPCAPGAGGCGLIGALLVGCSCPTAAAPATWGRVKALGRAAADR
jgi:hypothetical protein